MRGALLVAVAGAWAAGVAGYGAQTPWAPARLLALPSPGVCAARCAERWSVAPPGGPARPPLCNLHAAHPGGGRTANREQRRTQRGGHVGQPLRDKGGRTSSSAVPRVSVAQELAFEREGHCLLRGLVSGVALERLAEAVQAEYDHRAREAYAAKLSELGAGTSVRGAHEAKAALAKACRTRGLPIPALQVYNLHRADRPASRVIRELATSADLGRAAADLMGVESVMLYQTGAFYKFAGDPETAWHRWARLRALCAGTLLGTSESPHAPLLLLILDAISRYP